MPKYIDYKELAEYLAYDYYHGIVYWKKKTRNTKVGDVAGSLNKTCNRHYIRLKNKRYVLARVCYVLFYGENPKNCIDHIDGDRGNNKISNLRQATYKQNNMNKGVKSNNKLGVRGVGMVSSGKYRARITVDKKEINLGSFTNKEDAFAARKEAEKFYYKEYARAVNGR